MKAQLQQQFLNIYNKPAERFYFAPGRVNLIGEHIDYNGGLVMPCAINLGTYMLISANNDSMFRLKSLNFDQASDIVIKDHYQKDGNGWFNYPIGVINTFLKDGHQLTGLDVLFYGDIPIGSGLSSSASIEIVVAFALNEIFNAGYSKLELVKMCKAVENNFIGLNSGIMDQFAVAFGQKNKALLLNCDTLNYEAVDCNLGDYALAIINTNKSRKLSDSKYNERQQECQDALAVLKQHLDIEYLCDINSDTYKQYEHFITKDNVRKRAQHVIEENDRSKQAAIALNDNDIIKFGRLLYASHYSLRDKYEVSGKELDTIVEYCETNVNVAGARMTGAGFGGCAIALIKQNEFENFSNEVIKYYINKIGYAPSVYKTVINDGVNII